MKNLQKKTNLILTIIGLVILLAGAGYFVWHQTRSAKNEDQPVVQVTSDAQKFKQLYPEVADDNLFVFKNATEVIDLLENGTGVVYFGFPECKWCQKYVTYLDQVAREQGVGQVNYLDVRQIRKDNTAEYQKLVKILEKQLNKDDQGKPRIFVPEVVAVRQGKILGNNNMSSLNTSEDGTPNEWWTEKRVESLKKDLNALIRESELCVDSCSI